MTERDDWLHYKSEEAIYKAALSVISDPTNAHEIARRAMLDIDEMIYGCVTSAENAQVRINS